MKRFPRFLATFLVTGAAAVSPAAFGVSTGDFLAEAGIGAVCGYGTLAGGYGLFIVGNMQDDYGTNGTMVVGIAIMTAYPAATAAGVYAMGEAVDTPSANKFTAWVIPALAAYGASAVLIGGTAAVGFGHIGFAADALSKPFLTAWVYNLVKEPAPTGESRSPTLEPYVAAARGSDGTSIPLYGVALSF